MHRDFGRESKKTHPFSLLTNHDAFEAAGVWISYPFLGKSPISFMKISIRGTISSLGEVVLVTDPWPTVGPF